MAKNEMNLRVLGKNISVTPALHEAVEKSAAHLQRYSDDISNITVTLSVIGLNHKVDVTCNMRGRTLRVEKSADDMYVAISTTFDVLERKIVKYQDKNNKRRNRESIKMPETYEIEEDDEIKISKVKSFVIKPMTPEEACLQMDMLEHSFFVFKNSNTGGTSVVYKRHDNTYGLIDPATD